ncbi:HEAT repeat domain-containing protein [Streptomyces sp. NPDC054956]
METGTRGRPADPAPADPAGDPAIDPTGEGLRLIGSGDPAARERGCVLLGRAGERDESVRAGVATALAALAGHETDVRVLRALACALGGTADGRAVPVLVALAEHPDDRVRQEVAGAFTGVAGCPPDADAVRTLLALTRDADPRVRDLATFVLGFQLEADGPEIRSALWERTGDEDREVREEGVRGLARRHDPRAVPLLAELLAHPDGAHVHTFDAARILGVPELLPALLEYEPGDAGVAAAVNACDPASRAERDAGAWELVCALHRLRPDLDAAVSSELYGWDLTLSLAASPDPSHYDAEALLARAGGDPGRATELVSADLAPAEPVPAEVPAEPVPAEVPGAGPPARPGISVTGRCAGP